MKGWPRRLALWGGPAVLVLAAAGGTLVYTFLHTFYPAVPPPHFPPPRSVAEAQRQDLEYFRHYLKYNRTYTPAARGDASRLLEEYQAQAARMTPAQFDLAIARMAALADNGHSKVYPDIFRQRHNKLPCLLYRFSDGYYIVRARPACQSLLGAKLLAIDGHSTAEIVDRMFQYALGPRQHYDQYITPFYLESPELLNAAGLASAGDRVTLHVLLEDGREQETLMRADPPEPKWQWWIDSNFYLSGEPTPSAATDWKSLLPADAKLPLFLTDFGYPFLVESWPGIYYAAFRSNTSEKGHPIGRFVAKVKREISEQRPRFVIIDLRFDQGGDLTTTAGFMSHLTRLAPSIERVYVLTSAWTFSAGESSVALAKEHGGGRVTIVGEPVGDRLRFWGEGRDMTLPNSGIVLHYATGLHDYARPCWGEPGCFWVMYFFPMHLESIAPDVTIPYTFADYLALRDPMLCYVLQASANAAPAPNSQSSSSSSSTPVPKTCRLSSVSMSTSPPRASTGGLAGASTHVDVPARHGNQCHASDCRELFPPPAPI